MTIARYITGVISTANAKLPDGLYGEKFTWSHFLHMVVGYVSMTMAIGGLTLIGASPIAFNPAPKGQLSYILPITLLACTVQAFTTISMQVSHVARKPWEPFKNSALLFVWVGLALIYLGVVSDPTIGAQEIALATWAVLLIFLTMKWHFIICTCVQLREILGIRVFHVKAKNTDK